MSPIKLRYVNRYIDNRGRARYYVRRKGRPQVALPGLPGSAEFMAAYAAAIADVSPIQPSRHPVGTLGALATEYFRSPAFANLSPSSQRTYRLVLAPILEAHGHRLAKQLTASIAARMVSSIGEKRPGMANLTLSVMRNLMGHAIKLRLRSDNPFAGIDAYRLGTHHTWTDSELAAYEARWPLGTREYLAYALLLYTGQRGSDVVRMTRADVRNGMIRVVQQKTAEDEDDAHWIAIHPELARALEAGPTKGLSLIGNENGSPILRQTLGDLVRRAAAAAGLPRKCVAHGLRKAMARRLAEAGATTKQMQSVLGHRSLKEVERYSERASRGKLAREAIAKLTDRVVEGPSGEHGVPSGSDKSA